MPDGHGAQDVEEDEGAVGEIVAQQVAVRETLKKISIRFEAHRKDNVVWTSPLWQQAKAEAI